jgi:hypothetical protein
VIRENTEQKNTEQNVFGALLSNNRFVFCLMFVCSSYTGFTPQRAAAQVCVMLTPGSISPCGDGIAMGWFTVPALDYTRQGNRTIHPTSSG